MFLRRAFVSQQFIPSLGAGARQGVRSFGISYPRFAMQNHLPSIVAAPVHADIIPSVKPQQILWIGCSDSCYQETTILDVPPDEMMVHRNIGNMIVDGDISVETAVKHAVTDLKA